MFSPDAGQHLIDILPYFSGKYDPRVDEDEPNYLIDIYVHRYVGPNEDHFICMSRNKNYNKPCPICEYRQKLVDQRRKGEEGLDDEIKELYPRRRCIYAIWDRDNESKGVQIWEVSHWFSEFNVLPLAKPRKGGFIAFTEPDKEEGRSIAFEIVGKGQNQTFKGFNFEMREEEIPQEILDAVPTLDELLYFPEYEEVKKAFYAGKDDKLETIGKEEEEGGEDFPDFKFDKGKDSKEPEGCPFGGEFGKDYDIYEECLSVCKLAKECEEANKPPKEEEKPKPTARRRRE